MVQCRGVGSRVRFLSSQWSSEKQSVECARGLRGEGDEKLLKYIYSRDRRPVLHVDWRGDTRAENTGPNNQSLSDNNTREREWERERVSCEYIYIRTLAHNSVRHVTFFLLLSLYPSLLPLSLDPLEVALLPSTVLTLFRNKFWQDL